MTRIMGRTVNFNVKGLKASDIEWSALCQNSSPYVPVSKYDIIQILNSRHSSNLEFPIRSGSKLY